MCGIVGVLTNSKNNNQCVDYLLNGLRNLQNRGYDSAGICTISHKSFIVHKYASETTSALTKLNKIKNFHNDSTIGIGHTRWATHGGKTDQNSHPHLSSDNKFAIVHNGIIENFASLKKFLIEEGYTFLSQTDSEVISNLLAYNYIKFNNDIILTIKETINKLQGTWGLVIMCVDYENSLFCTKNGSPILIGQKDNLVIATSEQSGFDEEIEKYIILNNYDICTIQKNKDDIISVETIHEYNLKKL